MPSSFIPQRIKRAKQQITVKLYQDQLAMLDKYGRFIDDSRDYIISQALELVFKRDKEFGRWLEQQRNANRDAESITSRLPGSDRSGLIPVSEAFNLSAHPMCSIRLPNSTSAR